MISGEKYRPGGGSERQGASRRGRDPPADGPAFCRVRCHPRRNQPAGDHGEGRPDGLRRPHRYRRRSSYRQKKLEERFGIRKRESGARKQTEFEKKAQEIDHLDHGVAGRMIEFDGDLGLIIEAEGEPHDLRRGEKERRPSCQLLRDRGNPSVLKVKELTKHLSRSRGEEDRRDHECGFKHPG